MSHVITHTDRAPTAMVQVGKYQITVELPGGMRVGDPDWTYALGKSIAAGLEDAFTQFPPKASA